MTSLERFVKRLVQVLEATDPAGVHRPLSVAELRNDLLPYRANRGPLGLTSNDDYELLVIRLVAEEGDYVRTNPPAAAELARTEAAHPNPNLDLVEDLAGVTIQIGAAGLAMIARVTELPEPVRPARAEPRREFEEPVPDPATDPGSVVLVPAAPPEPRFEPEFEPLAETIDVEAAAPSPEPAEQAAACRSCHAVLPGHRAVSFCPFCGTRQGPPVCPRCSTGIEPGWRHCVACGYLVPPGAFA